MTSNPSRGFFRAISGGKAGRDRPRREHDFYPTIDVDPIRALLERDGAKIRACGGVWEPACGDGALVREIRAAGLACYASDLIDRGCEDARRLDYFKAKRTRARAIITNPPYNLINASRGKGAWLSHALTMRWDYMALLLNWDWPAARVNGLGELLKAAPFPAGSCFSYAYLCRWKIDFTGEGSPPQRNAWFVWDRTWTGDEPAFRFLDRPLTTATNVQPKIAPPGAIAAE